MKKSELYTQIENFVQYQMDNYDGADLHYLTIPSDKYDNVYIVAHYGKRHIEGVYVGVADAFGVVSGYNVTNEIIEPDTLKMGYYKESSFINKDAAVNAMYNTIISAGGNINDLLSNYSLEILASQDNPTPYPSTMYPDMVIY